MYIFNQPAPSLIFVLRNQMSNFSMEIVKINNLHDIFRPHNSEIRNARRVCDNCVTNPPKKLFKLDFFFFFRLFPFLKEKV